MTKAFSLTDYRIKPKEQLQLPWEVFHPKWKWAAQDWDGRVYVFEEKPECGNDVWSTGFGYLAQVDVLVIISYNGDWKDSLTERPNV